MSDAAPGPSAGRSWGCSSSGWCDDQPTHPQRQGTGDLDGNFLALDASNENTLYSFDTGGPIAGGVVILPPVSWTGGQGTDP